MSRIFISYKRVDKEKVFKIKDQIESSLGEKCWIDLDGIESDAQFANVIIHAINNCEVFLFMYSSAHSKIVDYKNDWTIRELDFAQHKKKRIVFVDIDSSELTDWFYMLFGTMQQVDATNPDNLRKLILDLKLWLQISKPPHSLQNKLEIHANDVSLNSKEETHANKLFGSHYNITVSKTVIKVLLITLTLIISIIFIILCCQNRQPTKSDKIYTKQDSIQQHNSYIGTYVTKTWTIRIDMLDDSTYTYTSWNNPKHSSDAPALTLNNGIFDIKKQCYIFKNQNFAYCVSINTEGNDALEIFNKSNSLKREVILEKH